ncbi:MAG: hypothetical protein UU23_C0001G0129 [Candidatus Curtissbacteria bacterium GW2011_GWA1_40_9]|uniref:Uncharacterized protein n=1 Tax=Candidatus Curtissbacteria bacterium GW2011_GWA1_40_9 TaxID=1618408 RepID=A0A0G0W249_9BACT|nr:MAG: hypothetical protein UU23_C0001G0129 [Candidatus Curtissbacteria bacterium GW2011_GWA1_40_9]
MPVSSPVINLLTFDLKDARQVTRAVSGIITQPRVLGSPIIK